MHALTYPKMSRHAVTFEDPGATDPRGEHITGDLNMSKVLLGKNEQQDQLLRRLMRVFSVIEDEEQRIRSMRSHLEIMKSPVRRARFLDCLEEIDEGTVPFAETLEKLRAV